MMKPTKAPRAAASLVLLVVLAWAVSAGAPKVVDVVEALPGARPEQASPVRCDPVAHRGIEPRIVEAGGEVAVLTQFDFACTDQKRTIYFFLVVENSEELNPGGFGGRALYRNARDGLAAFVDQMDYERGSRGGLVLYSSSAAERSELRGEDAGKRALKSAIDGITTGGRSANGAADAIALAASRLSESGAGPDVMRVILIMDAGAPISRSMDEVLAACQAARDDGIHVGLVSLDASEGRLADCADANSRRGSGRPNGQDLPETMGTMGDGLARADQSDRQAIVDRTTSEFAYVAGSASPREPDSSFAGEVGWEFDAPPPDEGHVIEYKLGVAPGVAGIVVPTSIESVLTMFYADGTFVELELENPEVCVYPPDTPSFCDRFALTLTPPVPTDTPEPDTPTPDGPDPTLETPSVTPEATAEATPTMLDHPFLVPIYLPVAMRIMDMVD